MTSPPETITAPRPEPPLPRILDAPPDPLLASEQVGAPTSVAVTRRSARQIGGRRGAPMLLVAGALLTWEIAVRLNATPPWLLPSPALIGETIWTDRALLLDHAAVTLTEVLLGFLVAVVAGVLLAAVITTSPLVDRALYPLIIASQTVPIPALSPLLLIWLGYGLAPKVIVTALVAFFPIVVNTVDGLRATDREIIDLLRSLGASRWTRFRLAHVPSALPALFTGAKVAVAISVIGAVFGELVGAKAGLGYLLVRSTAQFQTPRVFAVVVILALLGVLLFSLVAIAERLLLPWRRFVTRQ